MFYYVIYYVVSYSIVVIANAAADARAKRFGVTERRSSDGGGVPVPPSPYLGFPRGSIGWTCFCTGRGDDDERVGGCLSCAIKGGPSG